MKKQSYTGNYFEGDNEVMKHFALDRLLPFFRFWNMQKFLFHRDQKLWKEVRESDIDGLIYLLNSNHIVKTFITLNMFVITSDIELSIFS
jgi:hypothetical protein